MNLWFDFFIVLHSLPMSNFMSCSIRAGQNPEHHQDYQKIHQKVFCWQECCYWLSWNRVRTSELKKDSSVQRNPYVTLVQQTTFCSFLVLFHFVLYFVCLFFNSKYFFCPPSPPRQLDTLRNQTVLMLCHKLLGYYPMLPVLWSRKSPKEVEQNAYLLFILFISAEGL